MLCKLTRKKLSVYLHSNWDIQYNIIPGNPLSRELFFTLSTCTALWYVLAGKTRKSTCNQLCPIYKQLNKINSILPAAVPSQYIVIAATS